MKENIPADYAGPQLIWPLTESFVAGLIQYLITNSKCNGSTSNGDSYATCSTFLPRKYVVEILLAAKTLLQGSNVRLTEVRIASEGTQKLIVVGDLHGQLPDLYASFLIALMLIFSVLF